jgi:hypothetical protein
VKDTRLTYNFERIEHDGGVWHVDAKLDPAKKMVKVYRVYGDVTNRTKLDTAITKHFAQKLDALLKVRKAIMKEQK